MKKRLTENELRQIIYSNVRKALNEINVSTLQAAADKANQNSGEYEFKNSSDAWKRDEEGIPHDSTTWNGDPSVAKAVEIIMNALYNMDNESYHGRGESQAKKCFQYMEYVRDFLERKSKQVDNLQSGAEDKESESEAALYSAILGEKVTSEDLHYAAKRKDIEKRALEKYRSMSDEEVAAFENGLSSDAKWYYDNRF